MDPVDGVADVDDLFEAFHLDEKRLEGVQMFELPADRMRQSIFGNQINTYGDHQSERAPVYYEAENPDHD